MVVPGKNFSEFNALAYFPIFPVDGLKRSSLQ